MESLTQRLLNHQEQRAIPRVVQETKIAVKVGKYLTDWLAIIEE